MTENRRIALNIIATYGRSLYALVLGLFTARWALMALGEIDYGLYGVVGGLTVFISFFVNLLSGAIGRFYAYSVGQAKIGGSEGLECCRQWFNTALMIHIVLPIMFMILGYPLGEYALRHAWLNIPLDRVEACVWVFRFVCISCFFGMVNVPFNAMYTAKQYIAELTVYAFVSTTLNAVFLYYMVSHSGDWLFRYALWMCLLSIGPQIIIMIRAMAVFPECRVNCSYLWDWNRIKSLCKFAGWQFFGNLGALVQTQGYVLLINKFFSPAHNTTMALANTISAQTGTLTSAMNGAFYPAITTMAGEKDFGRMLDMTYRSCKLGMLACLVFAIPLILELNYVLTLWLKKLPVSLVEITIITLVKLVLNESTRGIGIAVTAEGRIAKFYFLLGTLNILSLPICWCWLWCGGGFISTFIVMFAISFVSCVWSVAIARKTIGVTLRRWLKEVVFPVSAVSALTFAAALAVRWCMPSNFTRLCLVGGTAVVVFVILSGLFVLTADERVFVRGRLDRIIKRK